MNYRRHKARHAGSVAREKSSEWRYPKVEKGSSQRSRAGVKRTVPAQALFRYGGELRLVAGKVIFESWPRDGWGDEICEEVLW